MSATSNLLLGSCTACSGTVSKNAKTCPHCGQANPLKAIQQKKRTWLYIVLLFGFIGVVNAIGGVESNMAGVQKTSQPSTSDAREQCISAIRANVSNPSTLDIHYMTGYAHEVDADGTERVVQTFSAKNGFGLEKTYDAQCIVSPKGKMTFRMVEQVN